MTAHAPIAPSAFHRTEKCNGWLYLSKDIANVSSEYADWGTEVHAFGEKALRLGLNGKSPQKVFDSIEDDDQLEMTEAYYDSCMGLYSRIRSFADKTYFFIEEKVKVTDNCWGTVDFGIAFLKDQKWHIVTKDLKTGKGKQVFVENNVQLMLYALGLAKYFELHHKDYPIGNVYIYLFQPHFYDEAQKQQLAYKDLLALEERVLKTEKKALHILYNGYKKEDEKKVLVAGDHCTFCPAIKKCPAHLKKRSAKDVSDFTELDSTFIEVTGQPQTASVIDEYVQLPPDLKSLPLKTLGRLYLKKNIITTWLEQTGDYLVACLRKGIEVPGVKLIQNPRGEDVIVDENYRETKVNGRGKGKGGATRVNGSSNKQITVSAEGDEFKRVLPSRATGTRKGSGATKGKAKKGNTSANKGREKRRVSKARSKLSAKKR